MRADTFVGMRYGVNIPPFTDSATVSGWETAIDVLVRSGPEALR